jgi:hypothetical protein
MKNATILVGGLLSAALITGQLRAQMSSTQADIAANGSAKAISAAGSSSGKAAAREAAFNKSTARAVKDLKSRFPNVSDEQWSHQSKGSWVYFASEGLKTRAYYDSRGHWQGSIKYCGEAQLPHDIRAIVKREYYDLAITMVAIVEIPDHKAYIVHLEDAKTLKIVRVNEDGEMDETNNYVKSN